MSKRRQQILAAKRARKKAEMENSGGKSKYARKRNYLDKIGKWGFQIPEPKPWK